MKPHCRNNYLVRTMLRIFRPEAFLTGMLVVFAALAAYSQTEQGTPPAVLGNESASPDPQTQELKEIMALYSTGEYEAVAKKSQAFLAKYSLTNENLGVVFLQAASHYQLGQIDDAINAYHQVIPFIEKLNSIQQRRYAFVFFMMGVLHRQQGRYDAAIEMVEAGLRREPQNAYYQILLGELFRERGDRNRAVRHFNEILVSGTSTNEEKTVLRIKIDRLSAAGLGSSVPIVQMSRERFYPGLAFTIAPLNYAAPERLLRNICLLLESKWLVGCEVVPPLTMDEAKIFDGKRGQLAGDQILNELRAFYPAATRSYRLVVALVGRDLFGPKTNYVFSWQSPSDGVGVVSAYRFVTGIHDFYEPDIIATRRLGIQFISTTGFMLGITRPTKPDCPMAYPNDFREFQQKGSKLCESTIRQRDEVLKARGGKPTQFGTQRSGEISRLYRNYYFE
jgi:predicted Zn-dependent protease/predicted negative regulator of RcsB-dependent stress response